MPHWQIDVDWDCSNLKFRSERSKKGMTNNNEWGVYAKRHSETNNPSFTHLVRRSMSPVFYKFAQSGRARQYQHDARQLRTLKERVGVVRATQLLRPGSTQLPFERAATLLKTACIAFCSPCLSGSGPRCEHRDLQFFQVGVIYSNLVLFQHGIKRNTNSIL